MDYKYITKNNLENKQNYMYSDYNGKDFLYAYIETREKFINIKYNCLYKDLNKYCKQELGDTFSELAQLLINIENNDKDINEVCIIIDKYVKSFEVKKLLFSQYLQGTMKSVDGAEYTIYDNYIIFALILIKLYGKTKRLKYLNCVLKVDDTLLSINEILNMQQKYYLNVILNKELEIINNLYEEKRR